MSRISFVSSAMLSLCGTGCDALQTRTSESATDKVLAGIAVQEGPGGTIRGELSGGDGRPQSGCRVWLDSGLETRTDANGAFQFTGLPPGEATVSAETLNGITLGQDITLGERETAQVRLAPPGKLVRLRGHASAFGRPLSGAQLFAHLDLEMDRGVTAQSTAVVDGNGDYELLLPGPGDYSLSVAARTTSSLFWSTAIDVAAVETLEFDIAILLRRISGRVTDAHGVGLGSISVYLEPESHPIGEAHVGAAIGETDAEGRYELLVSPGPHRLWADRSRIRWSRSYARTHRDLIVSEGDDLRDIDLAFVEDATLAGMAHGDHPGEVQIWIEGDVPPQALGWTDEYGRFELEIVPGEHLIGARGSALATREPVRVELAPGERRELDLMLVPARRAHLTMREGKPVGYVSVVDERGHRQPVQYDESGGAWLGPLVPGRYTVRADRVVLDRQDEKMVERTLDVAAGEEVLHIEMTFE